MKRKRKSQTAHPDSRSVDSSIVYTPHSKGGRTVLLAAFCFLLSAFRALDNFLIPSS